MNTTAWGTGNWRGRGWGSGGGKRKGGWGGGGKKERKESKWNTKRVHNPVLSRAKNNFTTMSPSIMSIMNLKADDTGLSTRVFASPLGTVSKKSERLAHLRDETWRTETPYLPFNYRFAPTSLLHLCPTSFHLCCFVYMDDLGCGGSCPLQ